jgi:hypothetical protein
MNVWFHISLAFTYMELSVENFILSFHSICVLYRTETIHMWFDNNFVNEAFKKLFLISSNHKRTICCSLSWSWSRGSFWLWWIYLLLFSIVNACIDNLDFTIWFLIEAFDLLNHLNRSHTIDNSTEYYILVVHV